MSQKLDSSMEIRIQSLSVDVRHRAAALFLLAIGLACDITCSISARASDKGPNDAALALSNVRVVDIEAGVALEPALVVIANGRIQSIGSAQAAPPGARTIECEGRYLMPGLWDMHAHFSQWLASERLHLPICIAWGVTAVQDMGDLIMADSPPGGEVRIKRRWSEEAIAGQRVGPRILAVPGFPIHRLKPESPEMQGYEFFACRTPDDFRQLARFFKNEALVDFAKMHDQVPISRDNYLAFMDEARRIGLSVRGHKPPVVTVAEAAAAGQASIEHVQGILLDSCAAMDQARSLNDMSTFTHPKFLRIAARTFDKERLNGHLAAMRDHGVWFCPTLLTRKSDALAAQRDIAFLTDSRLRYIATRVKQVWRQDTTRVAILAATPDLRKALADIRQLAYEITKRAHEMGVKVVAGTDAMDSYCFHGSGLHDELAELVAAGLTPAQALRAATLTPAEVLKRSDEFGSVAPGKAAELVLLDSNPLADIQNTRKIHAVILRDRVLDRAELDLLLSDVERAAADRLPGED